MFYTLEQPVYGDGDSAQALALLRVLWGVDLKAMSRSLQTDADKLKSCVFGGGLAFMVQNVGRFGWDT